MRILKRSLATIVIIWGLLALLVQAATPLLSNYRDGLAEILTEHLGAPVQIDALNARWYGLSPLIEIDRLTIGTGSESLSVDHAVIEIEPSGIFGGSLMAALRLTIDGMQLAAVRKPNGQLHLEGLGAFDLAADNTSAPPALPSHLRLLDTRLIWNDLKSGKPPLVLDQIAMTLDRSGDRLQLRAQLNSASGNMDLAADLKGYLWTTQWQGEARLKLDNLSVAQLIGPFLPPDYALRQLTIDLESWSRWENATLVAADGELGLRELEIEGRAEGATTLEMAQAGGQFRLQRTPAGLRLDVRRLQLDFGDHTWPVGDLAATLTTGDTDTRRLDLAADYLGLEGLSRLMLLRPPSAAVAEALDSLQAKGELRDFRVTATLDGQDDTWRAQTRFVDLETQPWGDIPGIQNLSGQLHAQQDHLQLKLDSRDSQLNFTGLFRNPLALSRLSGQLDVVDQGEENWLVRSDTLRATTPHLDTTTRLLLQQRPQQPLHIDLQTDFANGDAGNASLYYPTGIMGEELVAWLDRSIRSGRIPSGSALMYGPVDDFAFESSRTGSFQVVFDVEDVELDYHSGWPQISNLDAALKFHGNQLDITAREGRIYSSEIGRLSAHIGRLDPVSPIHIQGQLDGPLKNALQVLQEEALRERFGRFAEGLAADGDSRLTLDFTVPLGDDGEYALDGRLGFEQAGLALPDWDFALNEIDGQLAFDLDGLSAKGIEARAMGAPISVDVSPLPDGTTQIRAKAHLSKAAIARQLPSLPLAPASGSADFVIDVEIPPDSAPADSPTMLAVKSDLTGMRIDLPEPFGKLPENRTELSMELPLDSDGALGSLRYGDRLAARFDGAGKRVDLILGGGQASLGDKPGIRVRGRLDEIDIATWSDQLSALGGNRENTSHKVSLDLDIGRLTAGDIAFEQLRLTASGADRRWQGRIDAPDVNGAFDIPEDAKTGDARIALQRLKLHVPPDEEDTPPSPMPDPTAGPDPHSLPGLDLTIQALTINEAELGQLQLTAQHDVAGLRLTRFTLEGGQLELDANGNWTRSDDGNNSGFSGTISVKDLGSLLVDLGYSRQLEDTGGSIGFTLAWPGDPSQLHRATLDGTLNLDIGAGRLVELDPGVTRVVGLLNLNALTRRLRLDFSDVYKKGYSFDSIEGDFSFAEGAARTDNLVVLGPTGRIDLEGSADLIARTLNQKVKVTPSLDATLPIAGTLAGGPIAGVAVLVAQRVMSDEVDKINRFEYSVRGPWSDPEVKQLDSGGTLSKILRPLTGEQVAPPDAVQEAENTTAPVADKGSDVAIKADAGSDPSSSETGQSPEPTADESTNNANPLRRLLDVFKNAKPHQDTLPGTEN